MNRLRPAWLAAALFALPFLVYAPVLHYGFITYDDPLYVTENPWVASGLNALSWHAAWHENVAGNWHPVTMLSHLLDVQFFGMRGGGHHLTSLVIHAANGVLLFGLLFAMTGCRWTSVLAAAVFAVHPLNVDSVAWIAERKNLLSTFFWLLGTGVYLRYIRTPTLGWYLLLMAVFELGLLAKPMLITFPLTLLVLDFWPLERLCLREARWPRRLGELFLEKAPLLALAVATSLMTLKTQFQGTGRLPAEFFPYPARLGYAVINYAAYLGKMVWPARLAVLYPRPYQPPPLLPLALGAVLLAALSALAWRRRHTAGHWLAGWLWFLGTLLPVIGIVAIGQHSIADRYMYVPMIGLLVLGGWELKTLAARRPSARPALILAAAAAVLALAVTARAQVRHWENSTTLYRQALRVTRDNFVMHYNLGRALMDERRYADAREQFEATLRIFPEHYMALNNLGLLLALDNRPAEAVPCFEKSLALEPGNTVAHLNLARAQLRLGRYAAARNHFLRYLETDPGNIAARAGLAEAERRLGGLSGPPGR